ncbi:MAG: hypothetical protein KDB53_19210, partial [Planctomycetes bacterium]|nr:hypothetical protein [Planctomycetota bacterium]
SMSGSISDCQFISNGAAVIGVPLDTVPRFTNTVAFGNSGVDSIILGGADILSGTTTITTQNTVGGVLVAPNGTFGTIASGATLDLRPGCIIKWNLDGGLTVNGTLSCIGTAGQPVVLTTTADDLHGGDTNEDGMSYVAPNTWRGVSFAPGSDSSQLEHCHVRGAGRSGTPALTIEANVTIRQSRVELSAADGISLAGSMAQPSIRDCVISGCGGVAINGLRWSSLKEFKDNQIIANTGNFAQITSPDIGASDRLRTHTVPNAVVVLASDPVFQAGDNLTIEPGLIIKMTLDRSIALSSGKLEIQGTGLQPVIFTSIADDDFGGDTNGDGPSWVAPGWWRGIQFDVGASSTKVNHVVIRGAGRTGVPGLSIDHPGVILTAPRVDTCTATGMQIGRLNGNIANAVVWNVGGIGLRVNGGGTLVGHATVAQCGGAGISADPAWFGAVVNSISWGNNGGNFGGIIAPRILYSNGDSTAAASNGNLNVDPMFVDMGTGDLRLQANSPCLDAADATAANTIFEDHQEGSRLADDDLSGQALPDMGAYERTRWAMTVQGLPFIGRHQIYSILGPPDALGVLLLAGPDHAPSLFSDYGWLLIGDANQVQVAGVFHVGFPFTGTMPNDPALVGMRFAVQAIILSVTNTTRGQFSQRYRGQIIR